MLITIKPEKEKQKVTVGNSWVEVGILSEELSLLATKNFDEMWKQRPSQSGIVMSKEKEVVCKRRHQSYLNTPKRDMEKMKYSYMFSGKDESNITGPLPKVFQPFLDNFSDKQYNQVVANWYQGNKEYIPFHTDCIVGMPDNATITVVNFSKPSTFDVTTPNSPSLRTFILKKVGDSKTRIEIELKNGTFITMGGACQREFRHGVPKTKIDVPDRISLFFRSYQ